MSSFRRFLRGVGSLAKRGLWIITVLIIGGMIAYFEIEGLASMFPRTIAVFLAFIVMILFGIFSHQAEKADCRTSRRLARVFLIVTAIQFGLSFNEHLKHEGGKRAQGIEAASEASAIDEELADARADLDRQNAKIDNLAADIAGLEALVQHGAAIDAEIKSLTGRIYAINHDGKLESERDKREIQSMEHRIASLREERATTALPTPEELIRKRALLAEGRERVNRVESEVSELSLQRVSRRADAYRLDGTQHTFLSLADHFAEGERDIASLILIGSGSIWGLAIQAGFSWLCTLGLAGQQGRNPVIGEFAENGRAGTGDDQRKMEFAENVIAPQFQAPRFAEDLPESATNERPLPKSVGRKPDPIPEPAENDDPLPKLAEWERPLPESSRNSSWLKANEVRRLSRKLNRERLFDRYYPCRELDGVSIPERRRMCLRVLEAKTGTDTTSAA